MKKILFSTMLLGWSFFCLAQSFDSIRTGQVIFPSQGVAQIEFKVYGLDYAHTMFCIKYGVQGQPMTSFSIPFTGTAPSDTVFLKLYELEPGKTYTYQPFASCLGLAGPSKTFTVPTIPPPNPCAGFNPILLSGVSADLSGNYSTTVTNDNGCTKVLSVSVTVDCDDNPPAGGCNTTGITNNQGCEYGQTNFCPNSSQFFLSSPHPAIPGATYVWSDLSTVFNQPWRLLAKTSAGTWSYWVVETLPGGIPTQYCFEYTVNCGAPTPVIEPGNEQIGVGVYPNPAEDHVTVSISEQGQYSFKLFNSLGLLVQEINGGSETEIPLDGFPAGFYTLQVFSNSLPVGEAKKIIKQ